MYSKMTRVLERLQKYEALVENNPKDPTVHKRISSKLPLFEKMYMKLLQKRKELSLKNSFFGKSPRKNPGNESTCMDSRDFYSDHKSFKDTVSVSNSMHSLMKSMKTCNFTGNKVNESFDYRDEGVFDTKLTQIGDLITKLKVMVREC